MSLISEHQCTHAQEIEFRSINVTVYSLDENGDHDKQKFWQVVSAPENGEAPESYLMTIDEGDELSSQVPFSLTIYAGAAFK